jgi:hypothetical protein
VVTSFVLKQKKQKFKSPLLCFFSHKAFTLQSRAALRAIYILPLADYRLNNFQAKSKRPYPAAQATKCCPAFARSWEAMKK